ncbi:hypothetical protein SEA_MARIOKART_45 [Gordonia phage Mariokart]|nr:hypothetical protein SEA_MARIOKART_45 [Gordonia phage Mariokart]
MMIAERRVNPQMARDMLSSNTHNRRIREEHVADVRRLMLDGKWVFNGDSIRFSEDGTMLDGQHRLTALAGLPDDHPGFVMLIIEGLPNDTQATMDQGRRRTVGDQLDLSHLVQHNANLVGGAARVYLGWERGYLFSRTELTNIEIVRWAEENPDEVTTIEGLISSSARKLKARPSLSLAVFYKLHQVDEDAAAVFRHRAVTGEELTAKSPIMALRTRLENLSANSTRLPDRDAIGYMVTAWNAYRDGRELTKLQLPRERWTAKTFPVPR